MNIEEISGDRNVAAPQSSAEDRLLPIGGRKFVAMALGTILVIGFGLMTYLVIPENENAWKAFESLTTAWTWAFAAFVGGNVTEKFGKLKS